MKPQVDAVDIDVKTGTTLGFYEYGEDRPNVFLVSGMSGTSATDVYAGYLIMKFLDAVERIDGSITVLPVASPLSFRLGTTVSPLDSKDIDAVFPGDEKGTVTERTSREVWRRAVQADYLIHLRAGWNSCVNHIVCMHREYIHVRNLASQLALPLVVESPDARGALPIEAAHEGIPAVAIEMRGGRDQIEPQAAVEVREAFLNFLRIKDMIPGDRIEVSPSFMGIPHHVNVEHEGFFVPTVNVGEVVERGDVIGSVQDDKKVVSPYDGAVVSLSNINYVFEGDTIARIAPPLIEREDQNGAHQQLRRKW